MKYILITTLLLTNLLSAPAYNALRVFTQANGDEFMARGSGNHHLNWIEDENGEILKYNAQTKNYEYAKIDGDDLIASGHKYKPNSLNKSISKNSRAVKKIQKQELRDLMKRRKGVRFK